jgi:uncharacterized protein DUF5672
MKLDLRDVTICAADCATPSLASRALCLSTALCDFGDAILFSDNPPPSDRFRSARIERLNSRDDYSRFILKDLARFIATPFVLIVQWDGYVVEACAWNPRFREYDLIGAKWPWYGDGMSVGNGGFSLRSKRLLEAMSGDRCPFVPSVNEDEQICRLYRPRLVSEFGIRFAPESIADAFSYERTSPDAPTFGFHGLFSGRRAGLEAGALTCALVRRAGSASMRESRADRAQAAAIRRPTRRASLADTISPTHTRGRRRGA